MTFIKLFLFSLTFFLVFPCLAQNANSTTKAECAAFYDKQDVMYKQLKQKSLDKAYESNDDVLKTAALLMHYMMVFADYAPICGQYDDRFYDEQQRACVVYLESSSIRKFFEFRGKEQQGLEYCEAALERGDESTLVHMFQAYLRGQTIERNYKKALDAVEDFVAAYPEQEEWLYFTAPIYRRGGYGVDKNQKKAFEIVRKFAEKNKNNAIACELSIYYRDGIGTEANAVEADKWLNIYQENYPNKACKPHDWSFWFGEDAFADRLFEEMGYGIKR